MLRTATVVSLLGLVLSFVVFGLRPLEIDAPTVSQDLPLISLNDNVEPAGTLADGVLDLELEIVEGAWHLLGESQPAGEVLAFAERGEAPSVPGPLIRIPVGTEVSVTVTNNADSLVVIRGLSARSDGNLEPIELEAGATQSVRFSADIEGTYFYWGSFQGRPMSERAFEDSQLTGAFVVDGAGVVPDDRVLVVGTWFDGRLEDGAPDPTRLFPVINGRPWPHVERMVYDLGDSIRWRIINTSAGSHAFHLHGFYYQVNAKGDLARDTLYWPAQRRMAVTERMPAGTTMEMLWVPDRPGGWIFHCHMAIHVVPNPTMRGERLSEEEFQAMLYRNEHLERDADRHAEEGMGGLMTSVYVRPPEGWEPEELSRREMRLFVQSRPATGGLSGSQFAYVLQEGDAEPAKDSVRLPGSTLILHKGEPTRLRVINRTPEPTQIHWHGMEIESYYDGVAGISGYPELQTPAIAPGDSFDVYVTPPRAGSFMYHTHINDLRQQGSGLYGALIVLEAGETWDPEYDRVFIFGESPFRDDAIPVVNGGNPSPQEPLRVGRPYRFRLMQITLNRPETYATLVLDGFPVVWTPIAKDAFALPPTQRIPQIAQQKVVVGETYDYEFTPRLPGTLRLELRNGGGGLLVDQEIEVVN